MRYNLGNSKKVTPFRSEVLKLDINIKIGVSVASRAHKVSCSSPIAFNLKKVTLRKGGRKPSLKI